MNLLIRLLINAVAVFVIAHYYDGVQVDSYSTAIWIALTLGILNTIIKPILVFFTLPITILTFGLFLLVVNACIILLADYFIDGFRVNGLITALFFSILLSALEWILHKTLGTNNTKS